MQKCHQSSDQTKGAWTAVVSQFGVKILPAANNEPPALENNGQKDSETVQSASKYIWTI
jgi:hypothetical protein